ERFNTEDPALKAASAEAVGRRTDPVEQARAIRNWVDRRMTHKTMGVGAATASEALRTRRGDCTEHAVLLVALARGAGIPARTVEGLVYAPSFGRERDILGGHEWAQLYINGHWVDMDAAISGDPATVCRLAFSMGTADGKMDTTTGKTMFSLFGNIKSATAENVKTATSRATTPD
ncbi:MAG: transglutaminase-like domain-containing protein, partial [Phycisphaerae bacterium]|nr:transglutaminase-like domain-containing protein [Phycisphaerae bacterium]